MRLRTDIKDKTASVAHQATSLLHDAQQSATVMAEKTAAVANRASAQVAAVANLASAQVKETLSDQDARDTFLLGAAALAVVAAVGISYQRRADTHGS